MQFLQAKKLHENNHLVLSFRHDSFARGVSVCGRAAGLRSCASYFAGSVTVCGLVAGVCGDADGLSRGIPVCRPVAAFCGCSYGLSRGVAVDGAIARGGGCAGHFAGSVAVNGPVSVFRGCPDDFAMSIPDGLPFRAKSGRGQQEEQQGQKSTHGVHLILPVFRASSRNRCGKSSVWSYHRRCRCSRP